MRRRALGLIVAAMVGSASLAATGSPPVRTQLVSAVRSSRAHLRLLIVDRRASKLRLDVAVRDPAAYLKHRYARVVETIYPRLVSRFRSISLHVFDAASDRAVLSYSDVVTAPGGGRSQAWHIAWRYLDCARNLPLDDIEIDPDHAAPPCPAD